MPAFLSNLSANFHLRESKIYWKAKSQQSSRPNSGIYLPKNGNWHDNNKSLALFYIAITFEPIMQFENPLIFGLFFKLVKFEPTIKSPTSTESVTNLNNFFWDNRWKKELDDRTQCSLPTVVLANKSDLRGEGVGLRGEEDLHMETLVSGCRLQMRPKHLTHPSTPHIHSMRHLDLQHSSCPCTAFTCIT